ncbi:MULTISPECIES: HNH endonuclease [unclassified Thioalkalivibrio]|uniref:HNH endonuclease n=1 Tax=unclassified Thioalkalivibrio TaxID=2621013 RepID=UPI00036C6120|nr:MULTISPECIES: HNH endonuclease [unclassified Thioalkalivibrio]
MKTILFAWNPRKWVWDELPRAVVRANQEGSYRDEWSCGVTKNVQPGDRAFLIRLGEPPKGLIGSGIVLSSPRERHHWDAERRAKGDTANVVEIEFDVLSEQPVVDEAELRSKPLDAQDWFPQASGVTIASDVAEVLEARWAERAQRPAYSASMGVVEGKRLLTVATRYERNPEARRKCLEHYGLTCQACGMSFEERYGPIAKDLIEVHHNVRLSDIGKEYTVDPVHDLIPLCPNCHAVVHRQVPPLPVDELKKLIKARMGA